ncbi:HAMP domain-containing protein [Desmonostoc muscorum CCALA 125]|nr:HAMP domain-containing protein [Desmonostoc muscorum CCALA 125]
MFNFLSVFKLFSLKSPLGHKSIKKTSLTRKTLLNMTLRVAGVVLISTSVSYFHVISNLEAQTKKQLEKYITERGQRESNAFKLAQDNLIFLKQQILEQLKRPSEEDLAAKFDRVHFSWSDGTQRNAPQNQPISQFDIARYPTSYISRDAKMDARRKRVFMITYALIQAYGPAWSVRFPDTYFDTPDKNSVLYWKDVPVNLIGPPGFDLTKQEFYYVADPIHNPTRKPAWTGVYFDPNIKDWMVSAIVPVYEGDWFLGSVGHDIILKDLIEQTIKNQLPGTYNLIFRADGRLIAHPHYMDKIQQTQGKINIADLNDSHLQQIWQLAQNLRTGVIENVQNNEFLAVTRLDGPDWYFVTVYPKSLLSGAAFDTARFVLVAGALALLVEVILLFSVLQQQVAKPLQNLTLASDQLTNGNFEINLDDTRQDELGQLANSFNSMASQLKTSFTQLEQANAELEQRVTQRTTELQNTLKKLHRTQAQMVQSEKMSALGQMVAGVAHEINNPINFIHGNLSHVTHYTQDLLELTQLYHEHFLSPPPEIEERRAELDLDFLAEDLTKILQSMANGTGRIREIVLSLRNFSRLDEADCKTVNIHEGIDSTLMILQYRLNATNQRPEIQVIRDYGSLPQVECYAGEFNQALMNVLANAIDALEGSSTPTIIIRTKAIERSIIIAIADNGVGMTQAVRSRIFDPFFTTKPVGKGTGLGLSISYQIITELHGGKLYCDSVVGEGSEFVIEIPMQQM